MFWEDILHGQPSWPGGCVPEDQRQCTGQLEKGASLNAMKVSITDFVIMDLHTQLMFLFHQSQWLWGYLVVRVHIPVDFIVVRTYSPDSSSSLLNRTVPFGCTSIPSKTKPARTSWTVGGGVRASKKKVSPEPANLTHILPWCLQPTSTYSFGFCRHCYDRTSGQTGCKFSPASKRLILELNTTD